MKINHNYTVPCHGKPEQLLQANLLCLVDVADYMMHTSQLSHFSNKQNTKFHLIYEMIPEYISEEKDRSLAQITGEVQLFEQSISRSSS